MREDLLVEQLKSFLKKLILPNEWGEKILAQIEKWESEETQSSQNFILNLEKEIKEVLKKIKGRIGKEGI